MTGDPLVTAGIIGAVLFVLVVGFPMAIGQMLGL